MTLDIASARARLEEERARLMDEIDQLVHTDFPEDEPTIEGHPGRGNHIAETASQTAEHDKSLALLQNLRALETSVENALRKLDRGTYGICDECGNAIAPERLAAIPWATLCITCKARQERR